MTTYEIDVPLWKGKPPLTLNQRLHWREKAKRTQVTRDAVTWLVKALRLPSQEHISVQLHYATGDMRRRDQDNLVPTLKVCLDGCVRAGLVADDTPELVTWWAPEIVNGPGKRRLWITIHIAEEAA